MGKSLQNSNVNKQSKKIVIVFKKVQVKVRIGNWYLKPDKKQTFQGILKGVLKEKKKSGRAFQKKVKFIDLNKPNT